MDKVEATHAEGAHRVLIVDDHPDTAEILSVMFTLLGHEARSAPRGREALRTARSFDPALIVLDIGLPDISGYEVVNALRAASNGQDRYIVAVTGWSGRDDVEKAKRAGFDAHFVKPIDLGTIRDILRVTGKRARMRDDVTALSGTSPVARRGPRATFAPAARARASDRRE
jgi:DNA-binding response OmpR family regulator